MKINAHDKAGFTLVEIMVVIVIIGLLAAIALPNLVKARELSQKSTCVNNLRQIDAAVSNWGVEKGKTAGDPIVTTELFGLTNYIKAAPQCPAGGSYSFFNVSDIPQVACNLTGHTL